MKLSSVIIIMCLTLFACDSLKGPRGTTGPAGENGSPGEDLQVNVFIGTLTLGDRKPADTFSSTDYWQITTIYNLDNSFFTVHVRSGSSYVWQEPTWYFYSSRIYIIDDSKCDPGYEYRIAIAQ